jgi:3-oxoacyl-[acyl-carrier protein] reductase
VRLEDKMALVTGGGRGIGAAIAALYAREGASVIIADKNAATARATADAIGAAGGAARPFIGDVGSPDDCAAMVEACVAAFGRIDILVNNAGVAFHRLYVDTTLADWERVLRINLTGPFLVGQAAARRMIAQGAGGRIINIGSITGQRGSTGRSAYAVSKAGIMQLTRVMAVELAVHNIAVNAIAPGPIQTDITNHGPQQTQAYLDRIPMARYGRAHEVAGAALYLASDECQFVTGETINVDGGFGAAGLLFSQDEMRTFRSGGRD